ncbi:alpha/beta hydrolase [Bacillus sp. SCS-151]|uniref:alpha/beta hydrolase n=1 Tax=Nanhaiella sioensis TaxID=3115293 RepID=UPI003978F3FA
MIEQLFTLKNRVSINVRYSIPGGETILFLHFSSGNSHMWDSLIPYFTNHFNLIVPDIRGHGKSDSPKEGYHIDDMAADMNLLLKELGIKRCHIVGSSLGAEIALSFASSYPDMVKSIICEGALYNEFGPYGLINDSEEIKTETIDKRRIDLMNFTRPAFNTKDDFVNAMKNDFKKQGIWNEHFLNFVKHNMSKTEDGYFTNCFPLLARQEYIQHYWDVKFEEYYKKVKCPILMLPSDDEWHNLKAREIMIKFSTLVGKSEIKHIEGSKHAYMWMQFPKLMSTVVHDYLKRKVLSID